MILETRTEKLEPKRLKNRVEPIQNQTNYMVINYVKIKYLEQGLPTVVPDMVNINHQHRGYRRRDINRFKISLVF